MAKSKTDGMSHSWQANYQPRAAGDDIWNLPDNPRYSNDVADGWIRGHGGAEGKPGFQATPSGNIRGASGNASTTKPHGGPQMEYGQGSGCGRLEMIKKAIR